MSKIVEFHCTKLWAHAYLVPIHSTLAISISQHRINGVMNRSDDYMPWHMTWWHWNESKDCFAFSEYDAILPWYFEYVSLTYMKHFVFDTCWIYHSISTKIIWTLLLCVKSLFSKKRMNCHLNLIKISYKLTLENLRWLAFERCLTKYHFRPIPCYILLKKTRSEHY